jgi:hypothetical protein
MHRKNADRADRAVTHAYPKQEDAQTIALTVIGWIVADTGRAERFLAMTGLDPDQLRAGIGENAIQAAAIDFLLGHEPDLIACASAIGEKPETIAAARQGMAG